MLTEITKQIHSMTKCSSSSISLDTPNLSHAETSFATTYLSDSDSPRSETFPNSRDSMEADKNDKKDGKLKFSSLSRDHKVILVTVSITNLLNYFSLSSLAPFFPLEADRKGVDRTVSGWIFGVVALVKFLTSPLFGKLIPIAGTKFVLMSGTFLCGGCSLCFGFLDRIDTSNGNEVFIAMCFITRILLGLGCSAISNAGFVFLAQGFPDNVAFAFGICEIFTGVGMVAGPAVGGFLYDAGGFLLPFVVICAVCFVALPVIWLTLKQDIDSQGTDSGTFSMWKVAFQSKTIANSIVVAVAAANWSVFDPTLEPHLRVGVGPSVVGLFFLLMAVCYSVSAPVWGWLVNKLPDNRILLVSGFLFVAVGFLIIGPSPILGINIGNNALWLTGIAVTILSLSGCMTIIPTFDIYINVLSDVGYPENTQTYGIVSGLWSSMYSLGDFAGPSLGGFLNETIGFEWLTTCFAISSVLACMTVTFSWYMETTCRKLRNTKKGKQYTLLPMEMIEPSQPKYGNDIEPKCQ